MKFVHHGLEHAAGDEHLFPEGGPALLLVQLEEPEEQVGRDGEGEEREQQEEAPDAQVAREETLFPVASALFHGGSYPRRKDRSCLAHPAIWSPGMGRAMK